MSIQHLFTLAAGAVVYLDAHEEHLEPAAAIELGEKLIELGRAASEVS